MANLLDQVWKADNAAIEARDAAALARMRVGAESGRLRISHCSDDREIGSVLLNSSERGQVLLTVGEMHWIIREFQRILAEVPHA